MARPGPKHTRRTSTCPRTVLDTNGRCPFLSDIYKIRSMGQAPQRITQPLLDVLEVLLRALDEPDMQLHGYAIMRLTRRSGPTVYGVLDRLEDAKWVTGWWEEQAPDSARPRRRMYRLTPTGVVEARELLAERRWAARVRGRGNVLRPGVVTQLWRLAGGSA
jgi:PadR family transcriptional regulator, regulatory protein PadR